MIEAQLADGRVLSFPDGTDPNVIQSTVKKMIGGDQPTAQPTEQIAEPPAAMPVEQPTEQPQDFSLSETIGNIPSSAMKLGEDIIQPILHPIDTAKSLQSLGQGLVEKAFVPHEINGIDFGPTENEEVVNAVGGFIKERYGSIDAFKSTVQTDPVGALADIAGLLAGGSTLIPKVGQAANIGSKVAALGKAVDPLNISVSAVKAVAKGGKLIPQALPEKLLESALKFRPSIKPKQRASMTKTALSHGILPTVGGLEKITEKLDTLNVGLDNIIDTATKKGVTIPKGVIFTELKKLRRDLGGVKVNASPDLKVINRIAKDLDLNMRRLKKDRLTPRELQDLKTDAYKRINFDVKSGSAEAAKSETARAIAKGGKESLERLDPNVKGINKDMGDLLELNTELERVVSRLDNRNLISLDTAAKVAAGAASDAARGGAPIGTAIGTGAAIFGNPRVKARAALMLENLRKNAETVELINNKLPPVLARSLLEQSGRINDALNSQLEKEE
jgi:hypothetical protein